MPGAPLFALMVGNGVRHRRNCDKLYRWENDSHHLFLPWMFPHHHPPPFMGAIFPLHRCHVMQVTSRDGESVPLTVVHRKGLEMDGSSRLLLYG